VGSGGLTGLGAGASVTQLAAGSATVGKVVATVVNFGIANVVTENAIGEPAPVRIVDRLPAGVRAVKVEAWLGFPNQHTVLPVPGCKLESPGVGEPAAAVCNIENLPRLGRLIPPFAAIEVRTSVAVEAGARPGELNRIAVSGAGTREVSVARPLTIAASALEKTPFGVEAFEVTPEEEGGAIDTQAGSHPFQTTFTLDLNGEAQGFTPAGLGSVNPAGGARDVNVRFPPGLIGNPQPLPRCSETQFLAKNNGCPVGSVVGVADITINEPDVLGVIPLAVPVFNLEPQAGEPARLGFLAYGFEVPVYIDTSVRTGKDYAIVSEVHNVPQTIGFLSNTVTIWGVPGDARHNETRDGCLAIHSGNFPCEAFSQNNPPPFFELPTSCLGPLQASVELDSWEEPGVFRSSGLTQPMRAMDGCGRLPFNPSITVTPDVQSASSSTGLAVDVHVPQEESLNAKGLGESDPRNITVALPEGVAVNPSGGDGLAACSEGLVGFQGFSELETLPGAQTPIFTPKLPSPFAPGLNFCPDASKIGTAVIKTPLLSHPIEGAVYLATQNQNPFGSLIAMYVSAEDPVSGVLIKLTGQVHLTETGQLITTFENSPQAPFEDAIFHFFGGERAPLATPSHCGPYTTTAQFTAWSDEPGTPPHNAQSTFPVTSGPNGAPCPGASLPFSPSLTGGTSNVNAGSFSPLITTIGREDGQQNLQQVTLHMPAGLEGLLSGVKLCPEFQANEGTCGPESLIGETTVSAGVGSHPVSVTGGRVYITEKYAGAPFGLSIVNPVKAGPFDLEHDTSNPAQNPPCDCVVVRAKIEVNPTTAELTITTDASGPHAIPHLIDGIPVQIKTVNVTVNREKFTFNPTNCNPLSLTGTIASDEGATSPVSVPFQATNCAVLKYTPTLTVSTAGKASKPNGASLFFKIAYPKGAMGSQSWMKLMKFNIPKQLPARLTTIQKACIAATFESNRAACPPASIIGHVVVHTPVLPVPLEGPLYFVSYGGAAFPDAVAVLQGYGLTIESHGHTFIGGGVTSATFESVPDVPFESIEVTVPQGPFSEFGANLPASAHGSFCGQHLAMPVIFKAQNGLEIHQNTPVGVTGCPKGLTKAQKLAAALKACRKKHNKSRRQACERAARRAYGTKVSRTAKRKGH